MNPSTGHLILGFHGCDQRVKDEVLSRRSRLKQSRNRWDWLGHGTYFWESDQKRALEFARVLMKRPGSSIKNPSRIGAIIDLGNCLNLLNREHLSLVKRTYAGMKAALKLRMPRNRSLEKDGDLLIRELDCAVINYLHEAMRIEGYPEFDSVRAAFWEGEELYPGAGFRELNHIQICIRNPNCIKGYFDPLKPSTKWPAV